MPSRGSCRPSRWLMGAALGLALVLGASCATLDPEGRSVSALPLPEAYRLYGPTAPGPDRWWEAWGSDELNRLVDDALAGNYSLQQAAARIRQAAAAARQAEAARLPEITYSGEGSVGRARTDAGGAGDSGAMSAATRKLNALGVLLSDSGATSAVGGSNAVAQGLEVVRSGLDATDAKVQALDTLLSSDAPTATTSTVESYALGLTASYELDLWGRVRANARSSELAFEASLEDLYSARHTIAAQAVLTWLDIAQDRQMLAVLRAQRQANEVMLELVELRYRTGLATALDVFQQRQALAQSEALAPPFEARLQALLHQLAVLLGEPPRTELGVDASAYPDAGPFPEQGVPADLLALRPDVRAAGLRLRSADWAVTAARADRLPSVRLSAGARYSAEEFSLVFDNWIATLAASVTGPVFDAGRRKAETERARAAADERLAAYKESVLTAVREVEDALVYEARQREYIDALSRQLAAAENTRREALNRYRKGLNDYLPVLSATMNAQSLELSLIQAGHDLLVYRVQLHLALGGAWMRQTAPSEE